MRLEVVIKTGVLGMLAHQHGQAADVIQVAVRDDDEIEGLAAKRREVG